MFTRAGLVGTIVAAHLMLAARTASAQFPPPPPTVVTQHRTVDIGVFYESLAPFGSWIESPSYGWVWAPNDIDPEWRPYMLGHWVYTEYGWTWASDEPFGWAAYHYGRWHFDPYRGWVWIPGSQWGPAWVAWRSGDGWMGWSALPPHSGFQAALRLGKFELDISTIRNFSWCFIEERRMCEPNLHRYIARPTRNIPIVSVTKNITNYTVVNNVVINNSVNVEQIQRRIGRPIPTYRVVEAQAPRSTRVDVKANVFSLYRPKLSDDKPRQLPTALIPARPAPTAPSAEVIRRQEVERKAIGDRAAAERKALEDRQTRESQRLPAKGLSADELRKRHALERGALNEQVERERKLVERAQERERKGQEGRSTSNGRKFKL